jgi:hypothetical protein
MQREIWAKASIVIVQHVTFEPETFVTRSPTIYKILKIDVEKYFADVNTATASFRSNQFNLFEVLLPHTTTDSNSEFAQFYRLSYNKCLLYYTPITSRCHYWKLHHNHSKWDVLVTHICQLHEKSLQTSNFHSLFPT